MAEASDVGGSTGAQRGVAPGCAGPATSAGQLVRSFLRPCVLLLADEEAAYGYELQQRLAALVPGNWDHGTIYRVLNVMEDEGLVSSDWQRSAKGPQRRRYRVTDAGRQQLSEWARELSFVRNAIATFLERYERDLEAHATLLLGATPADQPGTEADILSELGDVRLLAGQPRPRPAS